MSARTIVHDLARLAAELASVAARLAEGADHDPAALIAEAEACAIAHVSRRTLAAARRAGEITGYGRQRSRSYRRADLDAWIEGRRVRPVSGVDDLDIARRMRRLAGRRSA